jgi:hypothetical protein
MTASTPQDKNAARDKSGQEAEQVNQRAPEKGGKASKRNAVCLAKRCRSAEISLRRSVDECADGNRVGKIEAELRDARSFREIREPEEESEVVGIVAGDGIEHSLRIGHVAHRKDRLDHFYRHGNDRRDKQQ